MSSASWRVAEPPDFGRLTQAANWAPLAGFALLFAALSRVLRVCAWRSFNSFRQYRLCNTSVCFLHSILSASLVLSFALSHAEVMYTDAATYFEPRMKLVLFMSVGYFLQDTLDLLGNEWSRWTLELFLHHCASMFVMCCAICSEKFVVYAYWALLMEVNSVFLHARTLLQLTGQSDKRPALFRATQWLNVITFVLFRFYPQYWMFVYCVTYRRQFHVFYLLVGGVGGLFFLIVNLFLFYRILSVDGFLGEEVRKAALRKQRRDDVINDEKAS